MTSAAATAAERLAEVSKEAKALDIKLGKQKIHYEHELALKTKQTKAANSAKRMLETQVQELTKQMNKRLAVAKEARDALKVQLKTAQEAAGNAQAEAQVLIGEMQEQLLAAQELQGKAERSAEAAKLQQAALKKEAQKHKAARVKAVNAALQAEESMTEKV